MQTLSQNQVPDKEQAVFELLNKVSHRVRMGGENIYVACPLAPYTDRHASNRDRDPSMGVKVRANAGCLVHCFGCEFKSGSLVRLFATLAEHNKDLLPFLAEAKLIEQIDLRALVSGVGSYGTRRIKKLSARVVPEEEYVQHAKRWHPYLEARGISFEQAQRWESGYNHEHKRVTFPVRNLEGGLIGVIGRSILPRYRPRYLEYFGFDKNKFLFGEQLFKPGNAVVVVEGIFDAIRADEQLSSIRDDYSVLALMGAKISKAQVDRISDIACEVVLALDNDRAGREGTERAASMLRRRICTRVVRWDFEGEDPATTGENFAQRVDDATIWFG